MERRKIWFWVLPVVAVVIVGGCSLLVDFDSKHVCGNGIVESGEECEPGAMDVMPPACPENSSQVAVCNRCKWDYSACSSCGNGALDEGEDCDPSYAGNAQVTCEDRDMQGGDWFLPCGADCRWDLSPCYRCGNEILEEAEPCDGNLFHDWSRLCPGITDKPATCTADCHIDMDQCPEVCGDGRLSSDEKCDLSAEPLNPDLTCREVSDDYLGVPSCSPTCEYEGCFAGVFYGDNNDDEAQDIAVDREGNLYVLATLGKNPNDGQYGSFIAVIKWSPRGISPEWVQVFEDYNNAEAVAFKLDQNNSMLYGVGVINKTGDQDDIAVFKVSLDGTMKSIRVYTSATIDSKDNSYDIDMDGVFLYVAGSTNASKLDGVNVPGFQTVNGVDAVLLKIRKQDLGIVQIHSRGFSNADAGHSVVYDPLNSSVFWGGVEYITEMAELKPRVFIERVDNQFVAQDIQITINDTAVFESQTLVVDVQNGVGKIYVAGTFKLNNITKSYVAIVEVTSTGMSEILHQERGVGGLRYRRLFLARNMQPKTMFLLGSTPANLDTSGQTRPGGVDVFLAQVDMSNFDFSSVRYFGSAENDDAGGMTLLKDGRMCMSGSFASDTNLSPEPFDISNRSSGVDVALWCEPLSPATSTK